MKIKTLLLTLVLNDVAQAVIVDNNSANTIDAEPQQALITNLNAVQSAFNNSNDTDNIKVCRYSDRTICKIRIRERMSAIIKLPDNDKIKTKILADNTNFSFTAIDSNRNRGELRGTYPGADTTLFVVGDSGFIYPFYVRIDSVKSKFLPDMVVKIKLNKKDQKKLDAFVIAQRKAQEHSKKQEQKSSAELVNKPEQNDLDYLDKKALISVTDLNLNFKQVSGDSALMPSKIFDDGVWTYFKYGDKDLTKTQDLPVVFKVKDGFDTPANYRIENGYIIAETTSDKWTIRLGQSHACVQKVKHNE